MSNDISIEATYNKPLACSPQVHAVGMSINKGGLNVCFQIAPEDARTLAADLIEAAMQAEVAEEEVIEARYRRSMRLVHSA